MACAARAARISPSPCTSPVRPAGARAIGIVARSPTIFVARERFETSTITRWRKRNESRSERLALIVISSYEPRSIKSKIARGNFRCAIARRSAIWVIGRIGQFRLRSFGILTGKRQRALELAGPTAPRLLARIIHERWPDRRGSRMNTEFFGSDRKDALRGIEFPANPQNPCRHWTSRNSATEP